MFPLMCGINWMEGGRGEIQKTVKVGGRISTEADNKEVPGV